jgi:exodeoxyribonuclease VII small subunit
MTKIKDFESALQRLEEIVKRLESGDLPWSLELFEEGVALSRFCHTKLERRGAKLKSS